MLQFGLIKTFGGSLCARPTGELLYNPSFECGVYGWHFDTNYPATITDNGDGSIHLKADSNYGSVVPDNQIFPIDDYVLEIEVANVVGNGKMSIRNQHNNWFNLEYFTTDGTYTVEYNGNIKDIHSGASNDTTFECDFLSYSLMKKVNYCKARNGELVNNYTFYCDGTDWRDYNSSSTFSNGEATVTRHGPDAKLFQLVYLEAGVDYDVELSVINTTESAYVSWIQPNSVSGFPIDYVTAGVHTATITPEVTGNHIIGLGVNSPNDSTATFDYISLKVKTAEYLTNDNGENLTNDLDENLMS